MMKISEIQKVVIALLIGLLLAIGWSIVAYVRFHNKIPFEFYCLYPLLLGISAVGSTMMLEGTLTGLHFKLPKVKFSAYGIVFAVILMFLPFAGNLIRNTVSSYDSPDDNGLIIFGMPIFIILALGEEIMWRGLVFSKLKEVRFGYRKSSVLIGVITALWNFPIIVFTRFLYPDKALSYVIPVFIFYSICLSFIHSYLRTLSKSIWPSVAMHGMCSYFLFSFIMPVEKPIAKGNDYYMGDIGIFYVVVAFILALTLTIQLFRKVKQRDEAHETDMNVGKRKKKSRSRSSSGSGSRRSQGERSNESLGDNSILEG